MQSICNHTPLGALDVVIACRKLKYRLLWRAEMTQAENQERQKARISLTMKPVRGETTIVQQTLDICLICCTKLSVVCTSFKKTSWCFRENFSLFSDNIGQESPIPVSGVE